LGGDYIGVSAGIQKRRGGGDSEALGKKDNGAEAGGSQN